MNYPWPSGCLVSRQRYRGKEWFERSVSLLFFSFGWDHKMGHVKTNRRHGTPHTMKFSSVSAAVSPRRSVWPVADRYAILLLVITPWQACDEPGPIHLIYPQPPNTKFKFYNNFVVLVRFAILVQQFTNDSHNCFSSWHMKKRCTLHKNVETRQA